MESLIEAGHVAGVLDVTTTEWADELVGGVMSAGPTRLEAAARTGTPAVIAPGCLDMVNFWEPHTLPEKYPRPPHLSAQSETNADPDRSRRECRAGTDHRRQTQHVHRTRGRLLSTAGHLGDLRTRRPIPLARSGCGAARVASDTPPEGHSNSRHGHAHQRPALRPCDGGGPAGDEPRGNPRAGVRRPRAPPRHWCNRRWRYRVCFGWTAKSRS